MRLQSRFFPGRAGTSSWRGWQGRGCDDLVGAGPRKGHAGVLRRACFPAFGVGAWTPGRTAVLLTSIISLLIPLHLRVFRCTFDSQGGALEALFTTSSHNAED